MDDFKNIFDQTISSIDDEEKISREECKKILQDRGVIEIFDYIVSILSQDQIENNKKLADGLEKIARKVFYNEKGGNLGKLNGFSANEKEEGKFYSYLVYCNCGYTTAGDRYWDRLSKATIMASVNIKTKDIVLLRVDQDDYWTIPQEDSKETIVKKVIKLVFNGRI